MRRMGRQYESDPDKDAVKIDKTSIQTFRRVFAYVKPYRGWFIFSAVTLVFSALLGLVLPLVFW
jgi:hypothetical protein